MNPAPACAVVAAALGALLGGAGYARRRGWVSPELSRKTIHAGLGSLCALFPWLFQDRWSVVGLAAGAVVFLLALRRLRRAPIGRGVGSALYDVGRSSLGEIWFPVAVAIVWWLSNGAPERFCLPVLILAWADAIAAVVGVNFGSHRYSTDEGKKSWEGSLAFLFTASVLTAGFLFAFGEREPVRCVATAAAIGLFTMSVEAVSRNGADNLLIPVACWAQLVVYAAMPTGAIVLRAVMLATLVGFVRLRPRFTPLNDGALFAACLSLYIFGVAGGLVGLVTAGLCFAIYAALNRWRPVGDADCHDTSGVFAVIFPGVVITFAGLVESGAATSSLLPGAFAAATAVMVVAHGAGGENRLKTFVLAFACGIFVAGVGLFVTPQATLVATFVSPVLSALVATLLWRVRVPSARTGRRLFEQTGATLPSLFLLLIGIP